MRRANLACAVALVMAAPLCGCRRDANTQITQPQFGGTPSRGAALINYYGCGSCHTIPGISAANGMVGPPLTGFSRRIYVAGLLRNTPDNLVYWIRYPQKVVPGNAMPEMNIDVRDARDIAAYLYTIR